MGNILDQNNQQVKNIHTNQQQNIHRHRSCYQVCQDAYQQTKFEIERLYPFSNNDDQKPYAIPMESNIYAPPKQLADRIQQIILIQSQFLKKPIYKKKSSRVRQQQPITSKHKIKQSQNHNSIEQKQQPTLVTLAKKHSSIEEEPQQYDQKFWKKQTPNVVIQGHWKQHLPHGLCQVYFPKGQIFVGYFDNGRPILEDCILIFQNGSYYHGSLVNFKFQGKNGKFVSQDDKIVYEGQWKNDVPCGKGKQTIQTDKQIMEYQGEFNTFGQKQGQNCLYVVKRKYNESQKIYEYKGGFKNNQLYGQSILKTNNGQNTLKGTFFPVGSVKQQQNHSQKIVVKSLQTKQFLFEGQLQRSLIDGHGKVTIQNNIENKIQYIGQIKNGKLHGKGQIIKSTAENIQNAQNVFWFDGIKLKHMKNFVDQDQLRYILNKIQEQFQKADKYSELTKNLTQYFNTHSYYGGNVHHSNILHGSSKSISQKEKNKQRFLFQMISQQKMKTIIQGSSNTNSSKISSSPLRLQQRKQLIIQLQKGKQLYLSSYKIHLQQNGSSSIKVIN